MLVYRTEITSNKRSAASCREYISLYSHTNSAAHASSSEPEGMTTPNC